MAQESRDCGQSGKLLMDQFLGLCNTEKISDQKERDLKVKLKASHLGPDQGAHAEEEGKGPPGLGSWKRRGPGREDRVEIGQKGLHQHCAIQSAPISVQATLQKHSMAAALLLTPGKKCITPDMHVLVLFSLENG